MSVDDLVRIVWAAMALLAVAGCSITAYGAIVAPLWFFTVGFSCGTVFFALIAAFTAKVAITGKA